MLNSGEATLVALATMFYSVTGRGLLTSPGMPKTDSRISTPASATSARVMMRHDLAHEPMHDFKGFRHSQLET